MNVDLYFIQRKGKDMNNKKIQPIFSYEEVSCEDRTNSIFDTYYKISRGIIFEYLAKEDIKNIIRFYKYLVLENGKGMLNEGAQILAQSEIEKNVGYTDFYSIRMKRVFLNKTFINTTKTVNKIPFHYIFIIDISSNFSSSILIRMIFYI